MKKKYILPNTNGKASLLITDNGEYLVSYNTTVLFKDKTGKLYRSWGSWSMTTGKHIKEYSGLNKAEYLALPYM